MKNGDVRLVYDLTADDYAEAFFDELDKKPFDRELLERFAALIPAGGQVCDLGCGPGHLTAHLAGLGLDAFGVDFSPQMVEAARSRVPGCEFRVGDMRALDVAPGALGGIAAFYSIIHLEPDDLRRAFSSMHRALMGGGALLLAYHAGAGSVSSDDWFGKGVSISANLLDPPAILDALTGLDFEIHESHVRDPYDFEYPTPRAYVLASKP
jgi:SAM-dependent methyltransferase